MTRADRVKGGPLGLLIGDTPGVPDEFHVAGDIPAPALLAQDNAL